MWSDKPRYVTNQTREFDLAPDGKRMVVLLKEREEISTAATHLNFLLNFFDEVRRRAPAGEK